MKRRICIAMAMIMALSLAACSHRTDPVEMTQDNTEIPTETESIPEITDTEPAMLEITEVTVQEESTTAEFTEPETTVEPETEVTVPETTAASEPETTVAAEEKTEEVDYSNVHLRDCIYGSDDLTGSLGLLSCINGVPYATAGSTFRIMDAAVAMLDLSTEPDAFDAVMTFMEGMNPIQRDYFSFSWEKIQREAEDTLNDFDQEQFDILAPGHDDFDITQYSAEDLETLNKKVQKLFSDYGITREWKNYTEKYPFFCIG